MCSMDAIGPMPVIQAGGGPPLPLPAREGSDSLWGLRPHWPPTARRALRVRCFLALAQAGPGWGGNPQLIHPPSPAGEGAGGGGAPAVSNPSAPYTYGPPPP